MGRGEESKGEEKGREREWKAKKGGVSRVSGKEIRRGDRKEEGRGSKGEMERKNGRKKQSKWKRNRAKKRGETSDHKLRTTTTLYTL